MPVVVSKVRTRLLRQVMYYSPLPKSWTECDRVTEQLLSDAFLALEQKDLSV
jgi:hypothetical protein